MGVALRGRGDGARASGPDAAEHLLNALVLVLHDAGEHVPGDLVF
jgi:hypothetical protein